MERTSGSYEVDGEAGDVDAVAADARSWLKLDLSDIDAAVEDSETIQVEVDSVAALHD